MYSNYSTKLKLVIITLALISSISLSLNTFSTSQIISKLAFAQQNPVPPNHRGIYRAIEPSNTVDTKANLASSEIQPDSLVHYQPITPASHYYTGSFNKAHINSFPISTTNLINSTNPLGTVQPVSLVHYQPIAAASSVDPITSTNFAGLGHTSTNDDGGSHHSSNDNSHDGGSHSNNNDHGGGTSSHHSSNDNSHDGGSHSDSTHHTSSSNDDNNDHGGGTSSHHSSHSSHSSHHFGNHHHDASASASADGGGASASASAG